MMKPALFSIVTCLLLVALFTTPKQADAAVTNKSSKEVKLPSNPPAVGKDGTINSTRQRQGRFLIGIGDDMGVNLPAIQFFPGIKYFTDKTSFLLPLLSSPAPVPIFVGGIIGLGAIAAVVAVLVSVSTMFIGKRDDSPDEDRPYVRDLSTLPPLDDYDADVNNNNDVDTNDVTVDDYDGSANNEDKWGHKNPIGGRFDGTAAPSGYGLPAKHHQNRRESLHGRTFAKR